ncbi:MAG: hypothetical protein IT376_00810 [Polyangiaceae bacterium]|nr:hypothetical protein [Polyangiaceae bacterium]
MDAATAAQLEQIDAARKKDRLAGIAIISISFLMSLGMSQWAKRESAPEVAAPPAPATTEGVVGWPGAVDAIATLPTARLATARARLRGISMEAVASDGTIDFAGGGARVRYAFQSLSGEGPQPSRAPGELPKRTFCGKQNVHLKAEGLIADPDLTDFPCPPGPIEDLPEPRCGPREVWRRAQEKGAPTDRLARVEYYRARVGPAWRFELPGTPHRYSFYGDCGRELDTMEGTGFVP